MGGPMGYPPRNIPRDDILHRSSHGGYDGYPMDEGASWGCSMRCAMVAWGIVWVYRHPRRHVPSIEYPTAYISYTIIYPMVGVFHRLQLGIPWDSSRNQRDLVMTRPMILAPLGFYCDGVSLGLVVIPIPRNNSWTTPRGI